MITTIHDHTTLPAKVSRGVSFDTSQLAGEHDEPTTKIVAAARKALSDANKSFAKAVNAIQANSRNAIIEKWKALQVEGRKLTDRIAIKRNGEGYFDNLARSADNEIRSAALELMNAKGERLPKRPTDDEIQKHETAIAEAKAAVAEAKAKRAEVDKAAETTLREIELLKVDLAEFEEREAACAKEYRTLFGDFPKGYGPPIQPTAPASEIGF
jgi:hypothetical protein